MLLTKHGDDTIFTTITCTGTAYSFSETTAAKKKEPKTTTMEKGPLGELDYGRIM